MTDEDALESLSNTLRDVQVQIISLKAMETDLKATIRERVGDSRGTIEAYGKPVLKVTYQKRFHAETARRVLSAYPQLLALVSNTSVDSAKAKAILPPALYAQCQRESAEPTITPVVSG